MPLEDSIHMRFFRLYLCLGNVTRRGSRRSLSTAAWIIRKCFFYTDIDKYTKHPCLFSSGVKTLTCRIQYGDFLFGFTEMLWKLHSLSIFHLCNQAIQANTTSGPLTQPLHTKQDAIPVNCTKHRVHEVAESPPPSNNNGQPGTFSRFKIC